MKVSFDNSMKSESAEFLCKCVLLLPKSINIDNWILKQNLGQIGWRTKKNYFKVQYKNLNSKQNHATKLESQASTSSYKDTAADEYLLSWTVITKVFLFLQIFPCSS